jgi:preprotein translocase subunit SecE
MALNREQKRLLKKQGEINEDGTQATTRRSRPAPKAQPAKEQRTTARVFVKEVRSELRKVAWPTRPETLNYSGVVALALVVVTSLIFVLDLAFSDIVQRIFGLK